MAAPQVAGAAALLLAAYAAGGANVTGRGLEVKALLLATVQRVPGMAHKVRGCIVAVTLTITPRPEGLSFVSVAQAPGSGSVPGGLLLRRRGRASVEPPQSLLLRTVEAWRGWGLTAYIPRLRSRHGSASPQASLSVARGPEVSSAGRSRAVRARWRRAGAWTRAAQASPPVARGLELGLELSSN